jgi:hypothetical protein
LPGPRLAACARCSGPGATAQVDDRARTDLIGQRAEEDVILTAGIVQVIQANQVDVTVRIIDHDVHHNSA